MNFTSPRSQFSQNPNLAEMQILQLGPGKIDFSGTC